MEPMKLGDRIFVLAHLWMQYPEYREFIYSLIDEDVDRWVTLDCSAAERALVTEDVLIQVCNELMPSEVIAPDVLFDKHATIHNAIKFHARMMEEGLLETTDIFFCPQGKTKEDWLECYKWGLEQDWIQTIGFSKIAIPQAFLSDWKDDQGIKEARHMAYDYLKERNMLLKPIHCLGQGSYTEFAYYNHPMMRSTDSVYPVLGAAHGINFMQDSETRIPTPHDFLETYDMSNIDMSLVESNVNMLRNSCKGKLYSELKKHE